MSIRKKYYAIFGLSENASKDEVRKAYRKLAMQYHPDKNSDPKAHQVFIDLAEAYEILINDKLPKEVNKQKARSEKSFDERRKEAELRYKQQQERDKFEEELYFKNLTNGWKWKYFTRFAKFAALLSILLLFDFTLPKHIENQTIESFSPTYRGLLGGNVICFQTDQKIEFFVKEPNAAIYTNYPQIKLFRTWIFHNPVKIEFETGNGITKTGYLDFNVLSLFPSIPILFLIPIITVYFRKKNYLFTFAYLFSFNIIGVCVIYFILSHDRWIHFLTLGFL